jgi:predicted DNA-binding transcriptional regulator YafY
MIAATRPPLARFRAIAALLAGGRHLTARSIAERLEVSHKTVMRDLEFMRDRLNLPIATDGCPYTPQSGYYFSSPVYLCPLCLHSSHPSH